MNNVEIVQALQVIVDAMVNDVKLQARQPVDIATVKTLTVDRRVLRQLPVFDSRRVMSTSRNDLTRQESLVRDVLITTLEIPEYTHDDGRIVCWFDMDVMGWRHQYHPVIVQTVDCACIVINVPDYVRRSVKHAVIV